MNGAICKQLLVSAPLLTLTAIASRSDTRRYLQRRSTLCDASIALHGFRLMRMFVASLATETNTFSPLPVDRSAFERAFYAPPGKHPETPTLCSAPVVAARSRAKSGGITLIEGTATWSEPAGLVSRGA